MFKDIRRALPLGSYEQGIRLLGDDSQPLLVNSTLPFLRLDSDGQALSDGHDSKIDACRGRTGGALEPGGSDGVPRLGGDVEMEAETPVAPSSSSSFSATSELRRDDASVGGSFTTWDRPPLTAASVEPSVVTDPWLAEGERGELTAVVQIRSPRKALAARFERLPAWGVAIATLGVFGIMYARINGFPPRSEANRHAEAAVPNPASTARTKAVGTMQPLVVPATGWPGAAGEGATASASSATPASKTPPAPATPPAPGPTMAAPAPLFALAGVDAPAAIAAPHPRGRVHTARPRRPGSPFPFDESSGRYEPRPGASIDMKGEPLSGFKGIVASDGAGSSNVRGVNVAVESSSLYLEVTLPRPESDRKFGVQVTPSWPTTLAIAGKSTTGFTVSFGTPAPAHSHIDWLLVR